ncbi:MAG: hypothetical protein V4530_01850 [Pseudomonadota bacterium]
MSGIAETGAVERIARVLAGQRPSANAKGSDPSAADDIDAVWPNFEADALAVLKTLREPDATMAGAGDVAVWARMIDAAIGTPVDPPMRTEPPEPGTDPMHEGP